MKDGSTVIETPLIGSGSQEEVDRRVGVLLELGTSRGFLTYEELNEKLPDEVVSPDKLDSLLMMIDEMGIKLIDEHDIGDFIKGPKSRNGQGGAKDKETSKKREKGQEPEVEAKDEEEEEFDLNLEEELAEASSKRIDDPVRMYLTQMGEIPLLTREQEIALAKKIELTRKISTAEDQADKATIGQRIPLNLGSVRQMLVRNRDDWDALATANKK